MSGELTATILVPTTGDRGPLLPHSVGSALRQTVEDIEVLVVGDGVDDTTRGIAEDLVAGDDRVRFFDFPKGQRRGEPNRDEVLRRHARGRIVCYLTDRDLYLPTHVEVLAGLLADADLAHTLRVSIEDDGELRHRRWPDLRLPEQLARHDEYPWLLPLSFVGHTMAAYERLPEGWAVTPDGWPTDRWMFRKFLAQPWCRVASSPEPTVIYLKRGDHGSSGWTTAQRRELLAAWDERATAPGFPAAFARDAHDALVTELATTSQELADLEARTLRRRGGRLVRRVLPRDAAERLLHTVRRGR